MNRSIVALAPKFGLFRNKFAEMTSRPDRTLVVRFVRCTLWFACRDSYAYYA